MSRPKLTYGIIVFIGILLLVKGLTIAINQVELIKYSYGFQLDFSIFMTLLQRGLFVEIVIIIVSFIGLFIRKNLGYKLLLLFPFFAIGLFFLIGNGFLNSNWIQLIVPLLIISLTNIRLIRQYFQIETMRSLWRNLSFSLAIGLLIALIFRLIMI